MPKLYFFTAVFKLILFFAIFVGTIFVFINAYFFVGEGRPPRILEVEPKFVGKDVVILPYTIKNYAGYGQVFEPEMEVGVKTANGESVKITFLVDSGAVVSTLPYDFANTLGKDVSKAQRIVLRGFGDKRTFGYMSDMQIAIKDKTYSIPVVFSEGETSKKILGRKGFFDSFTIIFDHKDSVIRLSQ